MDSILNLLTALQASIAGLQAQLNDAQAAVEQVSKDAYAKGFADGVASVPPAPVSDKIYSQAEMDAALKPLKDQIASMQVQIDGVPAQIQAGVDAAIADLKSKVKAELDKDVAGVEALLV